VHLGLIAIVVSEYDPAISFFVDVLGFDLVEDSPSLTNDGRPKRWVVVRPPGAASASASRRSMRACIVTHDRLPTKTHCSAAKRLPPLHVPDVMLSASIRQARGRRPADLKKFVWIRGRAGGDQADEHPGWPAGR
jgi:catechol 2,3-dioxygenase-like lactoylglutathione lyase family enzyme